MERVPEIVDGSLGLGFIFGVFIRLVLSVHFGYVFMNITKRLGIIFNPLDQYKSTILLKKHPWPGA